MALLPHNRGPRIVLGFLALVAFLFIPLRWNTLQSLRLTIITRLTQSPLTPLMNNNITYPRLGPHILSAEKAREYIDRLHAIRNVAFSPHDKVMQGHNLENVDRLLQYLARVEAGERLSIPRVVLSSWHFHPTCYEEDSSNGEVQWMRPVVSTRCLYKPTLINDPSWNSCKSKTFS